MEIWEQAEPSGVDKVTQEEYTTCYWKREDAMDTTLEHDHSRGQDQYNSLQRKCGNYSGHWFLGLFQLHRYVMFKFCIVWDRCRSQKF